MTASRLSSTATGTTQTCDYFPTPEMIMLNVIRLYDEELGTWLKVVIMWYYCEIESKYALTDTQIQYSSTWKNTIFIVNYKIDLTYS